MTEKFIPDGNPIGTLLHVEAFLEKFPGDSVVAKAFQAAQEIERLREALEAIDAHRLFIPERQAYTELKGIARTALKGGVNRGEDDGLDARNSNRSSNRLVDRDTALATEPPLAASRGGEGKCPCGEQSFAFNFEPGDGEITCAWCGRNMN